MNFLMSILFWKCRHKNLTWPRSQDGKKHQTCLDCGQKIDYEGEL